jgi:hypothetical protein
LKRGTSPAHRWFASLLCAVLLGGVQSSCGGGDEVAEATAAPTKEWSEDERIVALLRPCPEQGHFTGDTSEMLPVLVRKLEQSQRDVLHNVREELARGGDEAIAELARLVQRLYTERHGSHTIKNALGVIQMSDRGGTDEALAIVGSCLGHPQETVRSAAIRALTEHSAPALYDSLSSLLPIAGALSLPSLFTALHHADAVRFEEDFASWIAEDEYVENWADAARLVAMTATAESGERLGELDPDELDPETYAFLLAADSHHRGESALDELRKMIEGDDLQRRMNALVALQYTDSVSLMIGVLSGDPNPQLRQVAASQLAAHAKEPEVRPVLFAGISDSDHGTRASCLEALLAVGDEAAVDYVLTLLEGRQGEVEEALRASRGAWDANPRLVDRAREILSRRLDELRAEPFERWGFLIQALSVVPGPESARFLLDLARSFEEGSQGRGSYRSVVSQAGNTGPDGREVLMAAWRTEEDLEYRFDLLWAASFGHDESTRSFLTEVVLAERSAPHERLFVAERLAREGPAAEVAPLLKRATLRMTDSVFRPAMECLLWRWYG